MSFFSVLIRRRRWETRLLSYQTNLWLLLKSFRWALFSDLQHLQKPAWCFFVISLSWSDVFHMTCWSVMLGHRNSSGSSTRGKDEITNIKSLLEACQIKIHIWIHLFDPPNHVSSHFLWQQIKVRSSRSNPTCWWHVNVVRNITKV